MERTVTTVGFTLSSSSASSSSQTSQGQDPRRQPNNVGEIIGNQVGGNLQNTYWMVVFAEEPRPGSGQLRVGTNAGHVFIGVVDFTNPQQPATTVRGFYSTRPGPGLLRGETVAGQVRDDGMHVWSVAIGWQINQRQYQAIINRFQADTAQPPNYNLFEYNCTNWTFDVLNQEANINWRPQTRQVRDLRLNVHQTLTPGQTGWAIWQNPPPANGRRLTPPQGASKMPETAMEKEVTYVCKNCSHWGFAIIILGEDRRSDTSPKSTS